MRLDWRLCVLPVLLAAGLPAGAQPLPGLSHDPGAVPWVRPDRPEGTGNRARRNTRASGTGTCSVECNVIDFEGLGDTEVIGTIAGTPAVEFGPSWLGLIDMDDGGQGNFANEPSPSTIAFFLEPADPINFSEGVNFIEVFYVASANSVPVTLTAYDGPNGTGRVVAVDTGPTIGTEVDGAPCSGDPDGNYCLWDALTLTSNADDIRSLVLSGAIVNQFGFDNMTFCVSGDTDADGLLDVWEQCGIDADSDGTVDLDLPGMGADPDVPDIFVEVDAMTERAPLASTLAQVANVFAAKGITLHNQLDETNIPLAPWPNSFADFDVVKAARFGTVAERASANWANIRQAKALAFRYAVFADQFGGKGYSGLAEIGGDDFMVTLGHPSWPTSGGTVNEQAGTYMHELGHTLGLRHGGSDDILYKPNYHSVMNYTWQFPTAANATYWSLTYSGVALPTLDEGALDEASGIGGTADQKVAVGPPPLVLVPERGPVDWDADGATTGTNVSRDVTHLYSSDLASPGQTLVGFDDWSALDPNFRDSPDFGSGVHIFTTEDAEVDAETYMAAKDLAPINRWEITLGQQARGAVGQAEEVDDLWFYVPRDAHITAVAKADKGAGLTPVFTIVGPSSQVLVAPEATGGRSAAVAKAKKVVAVEGGLHRLSLSGGETTGGYSVKTKVQYAGRRADVVAVHATGGVLLLDGIVPGMAIKKLVIKAERARGDYEILDGQPSAVRPVVVALRSPHGENVDLSGSLKTSKSGKAVTIKRLDLLAAGDYQLLLSGADGTIGWARVIGQLAFSKGKGIVEEPVF